MKLDKSKDGWRSTRAKYVYLFVGGMVVSRMLGTPEPQTREVVKEVPVTTTITKTPEACKRALAIDNEIFTRVGQALGDTSQMPSATEYMVGIKDERTAKYGECVGS